MTNRSKQFCQEYIKDFIGTKAAIRAKYSPRTAYSQAGRLLKNVEVQEEIARLISEKLGTSPEELQYRLLKKLKAIALADITKDSKLVTKHRTENVLSLTGDIVETKEIPYQEVEFTDTEHSECNEAVASMKQNDKGVIEIKYHDQIKAIELLGKHSGLFKEKDISVTNNMNISNIDYSKLSTKALEEILEASKD